MNPLWSLLNALWWWGIGLLAFAASAAVVVGVVCAWLLWRAWRDIGRVRR